MEWREWAARLERVGLLRIGRKVISGDREERGGIEIWMKVGGKKCMCTYDQHTLLLHSQCGPFLLNSAMEKVPLHTRKWRGRGAVHLQTQHTYTYTYLGS